MATKKFKVALSEAANTADGMALSGPMTLSSTAIVSNKIRIPIDALGKGATAPAAVTLGHYTGYEYDIGDDSIFAFEPMSGWQSGTNILIKVYWYVNEAYATRSAEVRWQAVYACTPDDASEALDAATHTGTVNSGDINIPAAAKRLTTGTLIIPAASLTGDDVVGITLSRVALGGGTNPVAKPTIIRTEIYCTMNKLGE
jgi:hypothetical protein